MTIWPFIFARCELGDVYLNHEKIHGRQQVEMLVVLFLLWYSIEWLIRFCLYGDSNKAYKNISMEREAYANQNNPDYLNHRKLFSWTKYL